MGHRDQSCDHWTKIFIPNLHLGQFNLSNIERYTGTQNYTTRVVTTNYNQFAILYFKKVFNNQEYIKVTLYGRNKDLPSVLKEIFISFAKSLGLTEDHIIFPIPIGRMSAWINEQVCGALCCSHQPGNH
ncbi:neutrophil gelatinase-associated lipocalin-like [Prionailurus iriomotensis]